MSHDAIRNIVENARAKMEGEAVYVRVGRLIALIEERDQLATEVERLRLERGIVTLLCSVPSQFGIAEEDVPPFIRDHVRTPEAVDGVDDRDGNGEGADIVPNGQPTAPIEPDAKGDAGSGRPPATTSEPPDCCPYFPFCDCDEASNEPEQPNADVSIQDGDEMVTVNLNPSEQGAVDAILVQVSESGEITGPVEVLAKDIERAVCGSRQPPSQEAELVAPARAAQGFVEDRKDEPSGAKVVPWKASYTPDKCLLAIRMLVKGDATVSVAAGTGLEKITVSDIGKQYRSQIELAAEMDDRDREQFFASMYRQFLARWKAAGNDPAVQPDGPPKKKTPLVEAARRDYKRKGEKVDL